MDFELQFKAKALLLSDRYSHKSHSYDFQHPAMTSNVAPTLSASPMAKMRSASVKTAGHLIQQTFQPGVSVRISSRVDRISSFPKRNLLNL